MSIRKIPRQARSQQRVDAILDAAAALFGQVGYAAATTNEIAARAGVPIGSLYQFFANKEAILTALVDRYVAAMRAVSATTLTQDAVVTMPLYALIGQLVEGIAAFRGQEAGFNELFTNAGATALLAEKTAALHDEMVGLVDHLMGLRLPALRPDKRRLCAVVSVALVKSLMALTDAPDRLPAATAQHEIQAALLAYLRDMLTREGLPLEDDMWMPKNGAE